MDSIRLLAGECTVQFESDAEQARVQRGHVVVVIKPDRTTLVHDASGYQPVAWLTRPDALTVECADEAVARAGDTEAPASRSDSPPEGFGVTAREGDRRLRVVSHHVATVASVPVSRAGVPVGTHPDSGGALIRADGAVHDLSTEETYPLVSGATVLDTPCPDCGLPTMRVERGAPFEVCIDRDCEPLDDAVRERFDHAWTCPDCGDDLRTIRRRGRLLAGCDAYPDCETAFTIPTGRIVRECPCGLPVFETAAGERCLDGTCERYTENGARRTDAA